MALGFFRRNQKIVIFIMVALMVAFLIPTGASTLLQTSPSRRVVGTTRLGKLRMGDLTSAQVEMEVLRMVGVGERMGQGFGPTDLEFLYIQTNRGEKQDERYLAYALLLKEAEAAGIIVTEADVDEFLTQMGWPKGPQYDQLISIIRARPEGWTEGLLRSTVADWLRITRCHDDAQVNSPPSEPEIEHFYRDAFETIAVRAVSLPAADFLKDAGEPNDAQVRQQFDLYRTEYPDQATKVTDFGFGYRQPGRAALRYLLIRGEVVSRVVEPRPSEAYDYYNQNKAEFVKDVPVSRPASGPADANAASQPAETRKVQMSFSQAKPRIMEHLRSELMRTRMDEMMDSLYADVRRRLAAGAAVNDVYQTVRDALVRPAEPMLAKSLGDLKLTDVTLEEAVRRLADAAGLRAICYPWGTHGKQTLLPTVKVSLAAGPRLQTLGEALRKISDDLKWPQLVWRGCEGFPGVLFSVAAEGKGIDFFPVQVGAEAGMTRRQIEENDVLGSTYASPAGPSPRGENSLANIVFTAAGLAGDSRQVALIRVGEQGSPMYVFGDRPGRLLFILTAVYPAHVPTELDAALRRQVVDDWRIQRAFAAALAAAEKLRKAAGEVGLEKVAKAQHREVIETKPFPRRNPGTFQWSNVPALDLTAESPRLTAALRQYVVSRAFELAPASAAAAAAQGPPAVEVVTVPVQRRVLVLERSDFQPLVRKQYEEGGRAYTARILLTQRLQMLMARWFNVDEIKRRLDFRGQR